MVWCTHCGKEVAGVRPDDATLACNCCGRILESFYFSEEVGQSQESGNIVSSVQSGITSDGDTVESKNAPPASTAFEACTRILESKGLSKHIDFDRLKKLLDPSRIKKKEDEEDPEEDEEQDKK